MKNGKVISVEIENHLLLIEKGEIMTSKERVRAALQFQQVDRVPAAFEAVDSVKEKLMKHYGYTEYDQLLERYGIDIVYVSPKYVGPALKTYYNGKGDEVRSTYWGQEETYHDTGVDIYGTTTYFPLKGVDTLEKLEKCQFPKIEWFDYSVVEEQCDRYTDKAIVIGHEGPFQMVTGLMEMDEFFMLMIDDPEVAHAILDKMVAFELEYYTKIFESAEGKVDILRTHDDYGTQISLLFSIDMWREYFSENTKKLVDLAHSYGAFFQQHSCGAVGPIIPELISCGVDSLEPIQKVTGLEINLLEKLYRGKIAFHGGIDTQQVLPYGTEEEVRKETKCFINTLGKNSGYILMASQGFEGDVPIGNIEVMYEVCRNIETINV